MPCGCPLGVGEQVTAKPAAASASGKTLSLKALREWLEGEEQEWESALDNPPRFVVIDAIKYLKALEAAQAPSSLEKVRLEKTIWAKSHDAGFLDEVAIVVELTELEKILGLNFFGKLLDEAKKKEGG